MRTFFTDDFFSQNLFFLKIERETDNVWPNPLMPDRAIASNWNAEKEKHSLFQKLDSSLDDWVTRLILIVLQKRWKLAGNKKCRIFFSRNFGQKLNKREKTMDEIDWVETNFSFSLHFFRKIFWQSDPLARCFKAFYY